MITDPLFYLCAIPAILLFAMAKGGLGAGLGLLSVPLMSLVVPPAQAVAIIVPLLVVMDASAAWNFRGKWNAEQVKIMLPGALFGVLVGTFTFQYLSDDAMKILIAVIALSFSGNHYIKRYLSKADGGERPPAPTSVMRGRFWGAISGFTSFGIHAGGAPASVYLLPLKMEKTMLMATFALFLGAVNIAKVIAYTWLGELQSNLITSLALLPLAPIGVRLGYFLLHRISEKVIYQISYLSLVVLGTKLLVEGIRGVMG
ncbi:MAG: sulfite exporter TauE/SafE family protein [Porticoccaceae bacterium]